MASCNMNHEGSKQSLVKTGDSIESICVVDICTLLPFHIMMHPLLHSRSCIAGTETKMRFFQVRLLQHPTVFFKTEIGILD